MRFRYKRVISRLSSEKSTRSDFYPSDEQRCSQGYRGEELETRLTYETKHVDEQIFCLWITCGKHQKCSVGDPQGLGKSHL